MSLILEMLFLVFARTPSLGSEPLFCDRAFGLLASQTFLEPPHIGGVRSRVFATRGVELTSLASMARVTRSVSSLMGMFEGNLGSSFMTGSAKPSCGIPLLLNPPSSRCPINGDSMGSARC